MNAFQFSSTPLTPERYRGALAETRAGGYASFEGWVRDHNEGRHVTRLEYEAYAELAAAEGERIVSEALARFGILRAACVHRIGELAIGDLAVWVGVSSAHRAEAFDACRYIIDEVKHRLPIWKKEHYVDGDSGWVNCERCAAGHEAAHAHVELECEFDSLTAARAAGFELLDIREAWERALDPPDVDAGRLLPLSEWLEGRVQLTSGSRYLLVCAHGVRSLALTERLHELGHTSARSLRGGLAALGIGH